ncbi:uroporphyrinogen-III synthase [Macrococcus animalis]|uniref:uroporphyrinogen-III synthase n=1 Tax=Macrococcus animalis TaxID=3395467 RepID=UPI0039BDC9DD
MKPIVLMTDSKPYMDERVKILHLPFIGIRTLPIQTIRSHYDWLIFTSKNAVDIFFKNYPQAQYDKIAAIGSKTKEYLEQMGYLVDFVPSAFNQECFIKEMNNRFDGLSVCLPVSQNARPKMFNALKRSANVDRIDLYAPVSNKVNILKAASMITNGEVNWITFMSPSSVEAYCCHNWNKDVSIMAIGHVTSHALAEIGIEHYVSPLETKESMIESILKIEKEKVTKHEF